MTDYPSREGSGNDRDQARIRADIERTRAEMTNTVNEIEDRLSPEKLRDQAVSAVRDATIGRAEDMAQSATQTVRDASSSLVETIRSNPVPSALIGIGLGWLLFGRSGSPKHEYGYRGRAYTYPESYRDTGTRGPAERMQGTAERVQGTAERVQGTAERMAQQASGQAGDLTDEAKQRVSEIGGQAREQFEQVSSQARESMESARSWVSEAIDDSPLTVAVAALAVGAVIGAAIPETKTEGELFGAADERLMEAARGAASETVDKVKRVADEARYAAADAARQEGLPT